MANQSYQSPIINTLPKELTAYSKAAELFAHLAANTGGYGAVHFVTADFGITTASKLTVTLTGPLPSQLQIDRYSFTPFP